MSQIPRPGIDAALWVVDGNHPFWDALTWMDELIGYSTVKVWSVDDIVKACARDVIKKSRPLDFLAIFGHGATGYQSAGGGPRVETTGKKSISWHGATVHAGKSPLLGTAESVLRPLNGLLSAEAEVFLGGCFVGQGSRGDGLLRTLSTLWAGRTVTAFETAVYYWTGVMVGTMKTARGASISSSFGFRTI